MFIFASVLLGLVSMIAFGLANVFSKPLAKTYGSAQLLFERGFAVVVILGLVSIPTMHNLLYGWAALGALALGMAGYLPVLAFTKGVKESPLGVVTPIAGTAALITVLLSVLLLGVQINSAQWAAIVVVVAANIAVSVDIKNWRSSRVLHKGSGVPYAIIASLGWGVFFFALVPLADTLGPWLAAFLTELGVVVAAGLHILVAKAPIRFRDALAPSVVGNGVMICVGTLAYTIGVRYCNVPIVATLSNSTAIISTALGVILYQEHVKRIDRIAGTIMIVGIAALTFGG